MKIVFVDTNILIDFLADRNPFNKHATAIFEHAIDGETKLYTSSHSYATAHYVLKKYIEEAQLRQLLLSLLDFITVIPIDVAIIKKSLLSNYKDFEDAIQIIAAHSINNIDFIVTRDLKHFKDAGIVVLPPDELLKHL